MTKTAIGVEKVQKVEVVDMSKNKNIDAMVKCTNCGNKFPEKEVVYDGDEDMEFCPYCGEGGCIETLEDPGVESQKKYNEQIRNCDYIIEQATELRALLSHKNDSMMNYNFPRALADVEAIKTTLAKVEEFVKRFK